MKKLGITTLLGSVGLVALLSSSSFGASLKGISLDEDLNTACDKLIAIYKDNKKIKIERKSDRCGYDNMMFGYIGIESTNSKTVTSINLPVNLFGLGLLDGVKSHADKYVNSPDASVTTMDYHKNGKYEYYEGKSILNECSVTIDNMFIKLESNKIIKPKNDINFK